MENVISSTTIQSKANKTSLEKIFGKLWTLKRWHLFEFCDQKWLKGVWREAYLDGLNTTFKMFRLHNQLHVPFRNWLKDTKKTEVMELCSGGGGPIDTLLKQGNLPEINFTLSDYNPDVKAYEKMQNKYPGNIKYLKHKVDATQSKDMNGRLVFMCSSFHHFSPDHASKILHNAYENADGIFIREILTRNLFNVVSSIFNILPLMATPFFSKRFSFSKLLITTLIPIVPCMIIYDGIISVLRTYTKEEIFQLMPTKMQNNWKWKFGHTKILGFIHSPYIYGYKSNASQ